MFFEDYRPGDRRISGQGHIASWFVLAVLAGVLILTVPMASSDSVNNEIAVIEEEDCAAAYPV